MKNILLIVILLNSMMAIGQKNNFYGESGKQYYKLKVDKATYDLLKVQDDTIFFKVGIQGNSSYSNGIMTIKNLYYPVKDELRFQNDYEKQDNLNFNLNKMIGLDIQYSIKVNKLNIVTKPFVGYSKVEMKKIFWEDEVIREASNFIWFKSGIVFYFDSDGGFTNADYNKT